ncbi:MAG: RidA family protein [Patescibacteria group bacterium]|jgi:2-iminobutanoate/2-iminopropanoate deaminase
MKQVISSGNAPKAVGPYSQGIKSGEFLFLSGQIPLRPDGSLVEGDIEAQAAQVLENIKALLSEAGMGFQNVVKSTMFLADLADFQKANEVYAKYFTEPYPARVTIQVAGIPKGARIEIEVTAKA